MKKVIEPENNWQWKCQRCVYKYCSHCVNGVVVDFEIKDKPDGFNQDKIQWKGKKVCPYCYNQLIDKVIKIKESE